MAGGQQRAGWRRKEATPMATDTGKRSMVQQVITQERAALPLRFDFSHWGWKWLYLAAFLLDLGLLVVLMLAGSQPLVEALGKVPWVLWWFSMIGAMIVLTGILIWEDGYLHRQPRPLFLGVFYVLGSVWLFVYYLLCAKPADHRPVQEFTAARNIAAGTAAVMLVLTIYTAFSSPFSAMFANFDRYPGNIYYVLDTFFLIFFSTPLLWADARRRGIAAPWLYTLLLWLLGPFGWWYWFWQRPALLLVGVAG